MEESFTYDHLNRLTGIWLNNSQTGGMDYDAYGRMTGKTTDNTVVFSDAVYNATAKPHAIDYAEVDACSFSEQTVTYTCFDKVKTVTQGNNTLEYTYGYDRQRTFKEEYANGVERAKRYVGSCEFLLPPIENTTVEKILTYLSSPIGVFAVVEKQGNVETIHYVLKDNLGSWTTITDSVGNVEQELSFDAWGNRRDPETWQTSSQLPAPMFDRGFTGHEHLYAFSLINMNGRMYDPQMSLFLSVDAYVQSPDNSQSFNRYAYCLNNPLKYTDPSGWQMVGGTTPSNPFHENWGVNFAEKVVTSHEAREILWNMGISVGTWMVGNEMCGGSDSYEEPIIDLSELTPSQQEVFNSSVKYSTEKSSLFNKLYDILNDSPVIYKLLIGETTDDVPGQYNPDDNSITFINEYHLSQFLVYSEELIHAFQWSENNRLYNPKLDFNYEFEAKVLKEFMYYQITNGALNIVSNDSFKYAMAFLSPDGFDIKIPTSSTVDTPSFLLGYYVCAQFYSNWNKTKNYGNNNYWNSTLQKPHSIIRLIKY